MMLGVVRWVTFKCFSSVIDCCVCDFDSSRKSGEFIVHTLPAGLHSHSTTLCA